LPQVFERVASDVVLGAMDGVNGTVFAYGQTGSGKTFTIMGGATRYADRGIIPRAIALVFAEERRRSDHTFAVRPSPVAYFWPCFFVT
jgi:kinesin family protein 6/9